MCIFKFHEIWELMVGSKTKDSIHFALHLLTQSFSEHKSYLWYFYVLFFIFRGCQPLVSIHFHFMASPFVFHRWKKVYWFEEERFWFGTTWRCVNVNRMHFWLNYPFKDLEHIQWSHMVFLQCLSKVMFKCRGINNRCESFSFPAFYELSGEAKNSVSTPCTFDMCQYEWSSILWNMWKLHVS